MLTAFPLTNFALKLNFDLLGRKRLATLCNLKVIDNLCDNSLNLFHKFSLLLYQITVSQFSWLLLSLTSKIYKKTSIKLSKINLQSLTLFFNHKKASY